MRYQVCSWNALLERKKVRFQAGTRFVLVAVADGRPCAIADKCPHMGFPLSGGRYEDGVIRCKEHGLEIDVRTGLVANGVKADFLKLGPLDRSVRTYPAVVEDGNVFIEV
ncbi:MAG: Rieske 2Fe-2S domain-containing protein [Candidatus Izemoplasmatales bacterium]